MKNFTLKYLVALAQLLLVNSDRLRECTQFAYSNYSAGSVLKI